MDKDVCTVGVEVPMKDKYISEGFEGDLQTKPGVKTAASRILFLPKGILIPLIALLACVSSHVCSQAFAEEHTMMKAGTDRTDQTVQEMGIVKMPEDQHAEQFSKALDLDSLMKASQTPSGEKERT